MSITHPAPPDAPAEGQLPPSSDSVRISPSDTGWKPCCGAGSAVAGCNGWVVASETAALDIVGATFVRELEPGEMICIDAGGLRSARFADAEPKVQGLRLIVSYNFTLGRPL